MGNNIMGILAYGSDCGANMVILSLMAHCIVPSLWGDAFLATSTGDNWHDTLPVIGKKQAKYFERLRNFAFQLTF